MSTSSNSSNQINNQNNPNIIPGNTNTTTVEKNSSLSNGAVDCFEIVLCVLLPPLGVLVTGLETGVAGGTLCKDVLLNFLLILFLWIPGIKLINLDSLVN